MKKQTKIAIVINVAFVLAIVAGIVLLGGEEKAVPQAKVAKVTIACVPGQSEIDFDCDGIADAIDRDPTVPNPDQIVAECQTWHDCEEGSACRRGECEWAKVTITCAPDYNEFDLDCDGVGNDADACSNVAGTIEKRGCP